MDSTKSSWAETVRDLAQRAEPCEVLNLADGAQLVVHNGNIIKHVYPEWERPRHHISQAITFELAEDFINYITRHAGDIPGVEGTTPTMIHVEEDGRLKATLDPREHGGYDDWIVTLRPQETDAFRKIRRNVNAWLTRREMADFLLQVQTLISAPASADVLTLIRDMSVSKNVSFREGEEYQSGARKLLFNETVKGSGGSSGIEIPDKIMFRVAVFRSTQPVSFTADFRYRLEDDKLAFNLSAPWIDEMVRAVTQGIGWETKAQLPDCEWYGVEEPVRDPASEMKPAPKKAK